MNYLRALIYPRDEVVASLDRICRHRMTTTSGGNLSIRDEAGGTWAEPVRIDKGSLRVSGIVREASEGRLEGLHLPFSEFPFHREVKGTVSLKVRENWLPIFEARGVKVAFENHDHTYTRTPPIRGEKLDPTGIVFLGDGAWGVEPRPVHSVAETWYLQKAEPRRHVMIVEVLESTLEGRVYDQNGELFDRWSVPASGHW